MCKYSTGDVDSVTLNAIMDDVGISQRVIIERDNCLTPNFGVNPKPSDKQVRAIDRAILKTKLLPTTSFEDLFVAVNAKGVRSLNYQIGIGPLVALVIHLEERGAILADRVAVLEERRKES